MEKQLLLYVHEAIKALLSSVMLKHEHLVKMAVPERCACFDQNRSLTNVCDSVLISHREIIVIKLTLNQLGKVHFFSLSLFELVLSLVGNYQLWTKLVLQLVLQLYLVGDFRVFAFALLLTLSLACSCCFHLFWFWPTQICAHKLLLTLHSMIIPSGLKISCNPG